MAKQELTPAFLYSLIKDNAGKIEELRRGAAKQGREIRDIQEEYPLLPPEADDLSNAVKRKGVSVMGGKKSPAYHDRALRTKVFRDIYTEVKRQYGLINADGKHQSYKKLKRKYLTGAIKVIDNYDLPIALENEITDINEAGEMEE